MPKTMDHWQRLYEAYVIFSFIFHLTFIHHEFHSFTFHLIAIDSHSCLPPHDCEAWDLSASAVELSAVGGEGKGLGRF